MTEHPPLKTDHFQGPLLSIKILFQPELKGKVDTSQFENFSCATIDDSPPDETSGWDNEF